jgi:hypothetical protein
MASRIKNSEIRRCPEEAKKCLFRGFSTGSTRASRAALWRVAVEALVVIFVSNIHNYASIDNAVRTHILINYPAASSGV